MSKYNDYENDDNIFSQRQSNKRDYDEEDFFNFLPVDFVPETQDDTNMLI